MVSFSLRYAFVSHSETYDDYMAAMGMPAFVIRYLKRKAPSVRITSIGGEGDKAWYKWDYLVGEFPDMKTSAGSIPTRVGNSSLVNRWKYSESIPFLTFW